MINAKYSSLCLITIVFMASTVQAQNQQIAENTQREVGIFSLRSGGFSWVAFSSPNFAAALEQHKAYRIRGYEGDVLTGEFDGEIYFRLVFGQYATLKNARIARENLDFLPYDAWIVKLRSGMRLVPESKWLPLSDLIYMEPPAQTVSSETAPLSTIPDEKPPSPTPEPNIMPAEDQNTPDSPTQDITDEEEQQDPVSPLTRESVFSRFIDVDLQFSNIYEDNIDHDADFEAVQSVGTVPALRVRFQGVSSDPLVTFEYLVARHAYSNTERWDRISNAFRGALEPQISDALRTKTAVELSLKGSSEDDRDISNQFQIIQELEYRFTRRHRLQLYGTYRVKRFPDQPGVRDFKPNVGINFERSNSDGERFESGARYEFNKEEEARGNYRRWTFTVEYRTPEFNERDQFEIGVKHRRKFYTARFVEIEDEDFLRQDNRLSIGVSWSHQFNQNVELELGYEFETRGSNDPEKLYNANAVGLSMRYSL